MPEPSALGGVALAHALRELPAVGLGLVGLADELVPGRGVRGEQPFIGEEDDDPRGMEMVLDRDERLLEVAQEAGRRSPRRGRRRHRRWPSRSSPPRWRCARPRSSPRLPPTTRARHRRGRSARWRGPAARAGRRGRSCPTGRPSDSRNHLAARIPDRSSSSRGSDPLHAAVLLSAGQGTVPRPRRRSTSRSAATRARTTGFIEGGGAASQRSVGGVAMRRRRRGRFTVRPRRGGRGSHRAR